MILISRSLWSQTRYSLSHLDLVPMSAELDIEKLAGSDLSSATTGSTRTPSHVAGSERRSSVSTSAVPGEGKCAWPFCLHCFKKCS